MIEESTSDEDQFFRKNNNKMKDNKSGKFAAAAASEWSTIDYESNSNVRIFEKNWGDYVVYYTVKRHNDATLSYELPLFNRSLSTDGIISNV